MKWKSVPYLLIISLILSGLIGGCGSGSKKLAGKKTQRSFQQSTEGEIPVFVWPMEREMVSLELMIRGGTSNYPFPYQGIEHLAILTAVESGPKGMGTLKYQETRDLLGCSIQGYSDLERSGITLQCPRESLEKGFALLAQIILENAFEGSIFEEIKSRERLLRMREATDSGPITWQKAHSGFFRDQPFAKNPGGNPETLKTISFKEAKEYYEKLIGKARLVIIASGQVELDAVRILADSLLVELPQGFYQKEEFSPLVQASHHLEKTNRKEGDNFLLGLFPGPSGSEKEAAILELGLAILQYRFETMCNRDFKGSVAFAGFSGTDPGYGILSLRTLGSRKPVYALADSIRKFYLDGPTQKECDIFSNRLSILKWETLTTPSGLTSMASIEAGQGRNPAPGSYPALFEKIRKEDVRKVFRKYAASISWNYTGNADDLGSGPLEEPFE